MCRTLLVKSLLQHPDSMAAVVDTTGNFDVMRVYTLLLGQLKRSTDVLEAMKSETGATVEDVAAKILDRVKIMRVFDLVGVREAVGEIRDGLEGKSRVSGQRGEAKEKEEQAVETEAHIPETQGIPKRTCVADSEDEDDEEEEMLFDTTTTAPAPEPHTQPTFGQRQPDPIQPVQRETPLNPQDNHSTAKIKFILIDNLAQVINPLLKKDYIKGHPPLPYPSTPY